MGRNNISHFTCVPKEKPAEITCILDPFHEGQDLLEGLVESVKSLGRFIGPPLIKDLADAVDSVGDFAALFLVGVYRLDGGGYG